MDTVASGDFEEQVAGRFLRWTVAAHARSRRAGDAVREGGAAYLRGVA
jgi:hypothetical protein